MTPNLDNLEYMFNPGSVAFVGATEGKPKWGFIILNNLVSGGYEGRICPVNPGHAEIMGMECYPSVADIPGEVDLAVFTVPATAVVSGMDDCATKGVKAALVISAGFKELGDEGAGLESELVRKAEAAGIVLVGPNGQGVCCPENRFYPWMPIFYPAQGAIGFVCQSGNILNMLIGHSLDSGFGVSKGISSGNEAQLKTEDFLAYLAGDPDTDVIVSYLEGVEDGRRFLELSRETTRRKPVVLLKGGRTDAGVRAATSHTGAMAVSDRVFEDACGQAGITVADSIEDAGLTASSFVGRPLPRGRRVGIVTGGGGLGVIAADACSEQGLEVAPLSTGLLEAIGSDLPDYWVPGNPVDLVAGLDLSIVKPILETLMRSGEVDSVMLIMVESQRSKGVNIKETGGRGYDLSAMWNMTTSKLIGYLEEMYGLMWELEVPLYVTSNFDEFLDEESSTPGEKRVMMFGDVESACRAISAMARYHEYRAAVRAPAQEAQRSSMSRTRVDHP